MKHQQKLDWRSTLPRNRYGDRKWSFQFVFIMSGVVDKILKKKSNLLQSCVLKMAVLRKSVGRKCVGRKSLLKCRCLIKKINQIAPAYLIPLSMWWPS
jgi:hypothetical protein